MDMVLHKVGHGLLMAVGMVWQTGWSLVLGFTISAVLQSVVSSEQMRGAFGGGSIREIALATVAGAASSSCSYASAAVMRTLFKKGAALVTALAFLFASTNLVLELGLILYVLLGWQFMLGEWIGGLVLIAIMTALVKLTYPSRLVEEARQHKEESRGHEHMSMTVDGPTWWARLTKPEARIRVAQNFAMEWRMLWKDLALGFLIGGLLAALVPDSVWKALFLTDAPAWVRGPVDVVLGPIIAVLTFVCSIGNVPLAAVLWAGGVSFSGVLAFFYADLIVLPLLDIYRRYFGWRMAAYIGGVFFVTMAVAALIVDLAFTGLGWIPSRDVDVQAQMTTFSLNYTFWLNLLFGALAVYLLWVNHQNPMDHGHHMHEHEGHGGHACEPHHGAHQFVPSSEAIARGGAWSSMI